jgi:hypothetical protein
MCLEPVAGRQRRFHRADVDHQQQVEVIRLFLLDRAEARAIRQPKRILARRSAIRPQLRHKHREKNLWILLLEEPERLANLLHLIERENTAPIREVA